MPLDSRQQAVTSTSKPTQLTIHSVYLMLRMGTGRICPCAASNDARFMGQLEDAASAAMWTVRAGCPSVKCDAVAL